MVSGVDENKKYGFNKFFSRAPNQSSKINTKPKITVKIDGLIITIKDPNIAPKNTITF
jgi:hypothetical protein